MMEKSEIKNKIFLGIEAAKVQKNKSKFIALKSSLKTRYRSTIKSTGRIIGACGTQ